MTSTAFGQGARNALICGAVVAVVSFALAAVLSLILGRTIADCWGLSFALLCTAAFSVVVAQWLYGRKTAGRVLLDCGPHPTWWVFLVCLALITIGRTLQGSTGSSWPQVLGTIAFYVTLLGVAAGRLQVRENGIWGYCSLLRWSRIESYHWAVERDSFPLSVSVVCCRFAPSKSRPSMIC